MNGDQTLAIDYTRIPPASSIFGGVNLNSFCAASPELRSFKATERSVPPPSADRWVDDYLGRDVARFFYRWGGSLSSVMVRLRARYDGDLDQFLLHLLFVLTDLASANHAAEARAKGARTVVVRRKGLNLLSLSEITRIPRETVRRKLTVLAERGLVERGEDGLFYCGPETDIDQFFYALSPLFWDGVKP
jgi:hypothetical protein